MVRKLLDVLQSIVGAQVQVPEPKAALFSTPIPHTYVSAATEMEDFHELQTPEEDAIVFAENYQSPAHVGTTHGAYISGIEAAKKILRDIQKRSLEMENSE